MTELEQLKKEYREIPVPADGPHQMLETIASAKRKRNRFKNLAKYGSVAAAAVLVLLLPGMLLFSGSFAAKEDSAYMEADKVAAESTGADGMFDMKADTYKAPATNDMYTQGIIEDNATGAGGGFQKADEREAISKEILRQMEERMQTAGETYYSKSEKYPDGFEMINENQKHYYTAEGLLVIVFEAGEVAPKKQGAIEFVIPAEVFTP